MDFIFSRKLNDLPYPKNLTEWVKQLAGCSCFYTSAQTSDQLLNCGDHANGFTLTYPESLADIILFSMTR
jgi:hypothetical protein